MSALDDMETGGDAQDGAAVLAEVRAALVRWVVFPSAEAADAATVYAAATYAVDRLSVATRLVVTSPEKRCGKSRLLDVMEPLVHRPVTTVSISPAALVRMIDDQDPPTLLMDETDTVFSKNAKGESVELLRAVLNAGFQRGRPYIRYDAQSRRTEKCSTFAMAILAGIGRLPDTIEDRAVIITLARKAPGEEAEQFRLRRDRPKLTAIADRVAAWIEPLAESIGDAVPDMPSGLNDRAADLWEPLVAVADAAGGDWPERARRAALALSGGADDPAEASAGIRLLADLRDVFGDVQAMSSAVILAELHKLEEAPWADWYGHQLAPRDLARLLKPYGIKSRKVKVAGSAVQGYRAEDCYSAWSRYLPGGHVYAPPVEPVEPPEPRRSESFASGTYPEPMEPPEPIRNRLTCEVPQVPEVPHDPPNSVQPSVTHQTDVTESDGCKGCEAARSRPNAKCSVHGRQVARTPAPPGDAACKHCGEPLEPHQVKFGEHGQCAAQAAGRWLR